MRPVGVAPHVFYLRTLIANVVFIGGRDWLLVDAGMSGCGGSILGAARQLFGDAPPSAIILTHGHFDHVGGLQPLLAQWNDVPVYAHPMEMPYLTGQSDYPPPDPLVGGGVMSLVSRAFPRAAIDLGRRVRSLPEDGSVPGFDGWRWLHTPGHSPGHVSLFRDADRTLVAGDAVTTVKQESLFAVMTQRRALHGPPAYFTTNWEQARASTGRLADLEPAALITGHGRPMHGAAMREQLRALAGEFVIEVEPAFGRYVAAPARSDLHGVLSLPPDPLPKVLGALLAASAATAAGVLWMTRRRA